MLGGKLDLVAAEGLADLIDADTDAQRAQALHALSGEPARLFARWRGALVRALALAEAHADFGAEEVDAGGAWRYAGSGWRGMRAPAAGLAMLLRCSRRRWPPTDRAARPPIRPGSARPQEKDSA